MEENMHLKEAAVSLENEETVIQDIATQIENDIILDICFEMHRTVKLKNQISIFTDDKDEYYQDSKSFEGCILTRKLYDLEESKREESHNESQHQRRKNKRKRSNSEIIIEYDLSLKKHISEKDCRSICYSSLNYQENVGSSPFFELAEKEEEKKMKLSHAKVTFLRKTNDMNNNLCRCNNSGRATQWIFTENKMFLSLINLFSKKRGSELKFRVQKPNNEHLKISTVTSSPKIIPNLNCSEFTKDLLYLNSETVFEMEKTWIAEAFDCLECLNSKSFKDWMQFISPSDSMNSTSKFTDILCHNGHKGCLYLDRGQTEVDIFGHSEKALTKMMYKSTCMCIICKRKVGAIRYANHLATCMGLGRRKSLRIYSDSKIKDG